MRKKNNVVEPSKGPWVIDYMGKQEAVIKDAEGRLALVCPVLNAELIVNAVNAYSVEHDAENALLRAALTPVLNCEMKNMRSLGDVWKAVKEAQKIYKKGVEK